MTQDLITALEQADGPSRELDARIYCVFARPDLPTIGVTYLGRVARGNCAVKLVHHTSEKEARELPFYDFTNYTSSIDAALTLVPDGWEWEIDNCLASNSDGVIYTVKMGTIFGSTEHPCLPIAICIAALKAQEQDNELSRCHIHSL